jgi:hypothetical protein
MVRAFTHRCWTEHALLEVLRGYLGDSSAKPLFEEDTQLGKAFGVVGQGYQRPFELATVRLQNMVGSLSNCVLLLGSSCTIASILQFFQNFLPCGTVLALCFAGRAHE